jgi:hypothetical protein
MMGKPNIVSGRGTRLRALDEQTLVPPDGVFFQYSKIPAFHYSFLSYQSACSRPATAGPGGAFTH